MDDDFRSCGANDRCHDGSFQGDTDDGDDEERVMELERAAASRWAASDCEEDGASERGDGAVDEEGEDDASTYVPRKVDDYDGEATCVPRDVDASTAAEPREEEPHDKREAAIDQLACVASLCLKHPRLFWDLEGRLEALIARRIAMQSGQKNRRLFGRWLRDFASRACATYGPEELLYLITLSTRPGHPQWSIDLWRDDVDALRDDEGRLHEWRDYADYDDD